MPPTTAQQAAAHSIAMHAAHVQGGTRKSTKHGWDTSNEEERGTRQHQYRVRLQQEGERAEHAHAQQRRAFRVHLEAHGKIRESKSHCAEKAGKFFEKPC